MLSVIEKKALDDDGRALVTAFCLASDPKPVDRFKNGSELHELDPETNTFTIYYFNEEATNDDDKWVPVARITYDESEG